MVVGANEPSALKQHMPRNVSWNEPPGGMNVWVKLPAGILSAPLLMLCRDKGVDFAPAPLFMPDRKDTSALRLSFTRSTEEQLTKGVRILGEVVADALSNPKQLRQLSAEYQDFVGG